MTPDTPIDSEALSAVAERLGLRLVIRFGSRAAGAVPPPDAGSDLDVALLAAPAQRVSLHEAAAALADVFPDADLDVAILNDADPLFLAEIFQRCDLLWGDPLDFAEWQAYAYRAFHGSADLRATERALSRRKLGLLLDAAS